MKSATESPTPKVVVYTVIFDGYDAVFPVKRRDESFDHVLISDREAPQGSGWQSLTAPPEIADFNSAQKNRWCKFFPHRIFPDHDISVYIDGNIQLLKPLHELVSGFRMQGAGMGLFKHPVRQSVAEELQACLALGKLSAGAARIVTERLEQYESADLNRNPLTENGVIFRSHHAPHLDETMTQWWSEYNRVGRDQIALPWVLQQSLLDVAVWDWSYRNANPWFLGPVIPHLGNLPEGWAARVKLFLKHQKLRYRNRRESKGSDWSNAGSAFFQSETRTPGTGC